MPGRTVLQWDKDDCADAGLVKFDLLGLGMLSALQNAFTLVREHEGLARRPARAAPGGPARLRPAVRGGHRRRVPGRVPRADGHAAAAAAATVLRHRRRGRAHPARAHPGRLGAPVHRPRYQGREKVTYLHPLLEKSLSKTLGVPLFQEQLMQMAIDVADFTGAEADQLRRAMGSKRSRRRWRRCTPGCSTAWSARGSSRGRRRADLRQAQGVRRLRVPRVARLLLRLPRLRQHVAQGAPPGRVLRRPARGAAHGVLLAAVARGRRAAARVTVLRPDVQSSGVLAGLERVPGTVGPALPLAPLEGGTTLPAARSPEALRSLAASGARAQRGVTPSAADDVARVRRRRRRPVGRRRRHPARRRPRRPVRRRRRARGPAGPGVGARDRRRRRRGAGRGARRANGPFTDLRDLVRRVRLTTAQLEALATGGALGGIPGPDGRGVDRREALWAAGALGPGGSGHPARGVASGSPPRRCPA